jgi:hypothetical protein
VNLLVGNAVPSSAPIKGEHRKQKLGERTVAKKKKAATKKKASTAKHSKKKKAAKKKK